MKLLRAVSTSLLLVSLLVLSACPGNVQQGGDAPQQSGERGGGGGE
jgi:hypothetical protein